MIIWPESLVEELSARRCIVFMGAGTSASCKRPVDEGEESPPPWSQLLANLHSKCNKGDIGDWALAKNMLDEGRFLDCAEILKTCVHDADFSAFISETFSRYRPTEIHQSLNRIDSKVIVTTNFDKIYESYCLQGDASRAYVVLKYYDEGLVARLRSPQRIVIKAHGCMDTPEKTILRRSEFFAGRQRHQAFFRVLEGLFLTHTLLFVGYSLQDPDIQLVLENASIVADSAHPHYAVLPRGANPPAISKAFRSAYGIELLEYDSAENHSQLTSSLAELAEQVLARREEQQNE